MNEICKSIKEALASSFQNIRISLETYDRQALCCGVPCWKWIYHMLHSADKWLISPCNYKEPTFHVDGLDDPYSQCDVILSDKQLFEYLCEVEHKIYAHLDSIEDDELYKKPNECEDTRIEIIFRLLRKLSYRTGVLDGRTLMERENISHQYLEWQERIMENSSRKAV